MSNCCLPAKAYREGDAEFRLTFTPPLDHHPLTILCRRRIWGLYFSSLQEAQLCFDPALNDSRDRLRHTVRWVCEKLLLRVRFSLPEWLIQGPLTTEILDGLNKFSEPRELMCRIRAVGGELATYGQHPEPERAHAINRSAHPSLPWKDWMRSPPSSPWLSLRIRMGNFGTRDPVSCENQKVRSAGTCGSGCWSNLVPVAMAAFPSRRTWRTSRPCSRKP